MGRLYLHYLTFAVLWPVPLPVHAPHLVLLVPCSSPDTDGMTYVWMCERQNLVWIGLTVGFVGEA